MDEVNLEKQEISLGETLLKQGWKQGTLFNAHSACFRYNNLASSSDAIETVISRERMLKSGEKLIVISQDCDIKASVDKEPYIETLICKRYNQQFINRIGNTNTTTRWFVIDSTTRLVAEAKYRVLFTKESLLNLSPEIWPSGPRRLDEFTRWLARRYDRPAIPDIMVDFFQRPLEELIHLFEQEKPDIFSNFNKVVSDIRINIPVTEEPPFNLQLTLLIQTNGISNEELEALEAIKDAILSRFSNTAVHLNQEIRTLTDEEISLAEFYATRPIYFDYYTYKGEEIEGEEPHGRN